MANPITTLLGGGGGTGPFKGMQVHMGSVTQCAREVVPLIDCLIAGDNEAVTRHVDRIFALEAEADGHKNEIRKHLPRSLFMPVDRRDFLEILHTQDSIADTAQDIAGLLLERPMVVPPAMAENLKALTKRCVEVVELTHELINLLDELLAVGFGGRTAQQVSDLANQINHAEDDTDNLGIALTKALFSLEDELGAVSVMLWYQQIQWIGDLADHAEKVANRIRLIIG